MASFKAVFITFIKTILLWKEYVLTAEPGSLDGLIRNSVLTSAGTTTTIGSIVIRTIMYAMYMRSSGATGKYLQIFLRRGTTGFTVMLCSPRDIISLFLLTWLRQKEGCAGHTVLNMASGSQEKAIWN